MLSDRWSSQMKLSADDVDTIVEQVLQKKGLNEDDTLGNLKNKFEVCKTIINITISVYPVVL